MAQFENVDAKELIRILFEEEEVSKQDAQRIYKEHRQEGTNVIDLLTTGGVREDAILYAISHMHGIDMVQLEGMEIPQPLIDMVPGNVAHSYRIIPFRMDDDALVIATGDPDNLSALDDLKFMLQVDQVRPALTSEAAIERALERYYVQAADGGELDDFIKTYQEEVISDGNMDVIDIGSLDDLDQSDGAAMAESEPVRKLLNLILLTAVKAQASDIHFEPFETEFRVRNRIDGILYEMMPVPKTLSMPLVARIKVMSGLDIAERRMPQDGKISVTIGSKMVDLRVSCLPTMFGESVVIRVLDRSVVSLDLDKIGMYDQDLEYFRGLLKRPNGIVVVTGPTGSGKTTTLYAALNEANEESVKIITTEDPVEYEIDGLIQVPIDEEIGKTFSNCLRSILRQDPDKILVGEIRDLETAKTAIEAALTGHIVFSTLHTNDAPTAVSRLLDMGMEPFLIAATLESIIAQRLVRTICAKCKKPYDPSSEELQLLGMNEDTLSGQNFYYGAGCEVCNNTGYKGRTALFEILDMNEKIRELILASSSSGHIRAEARRMGMRTLRDAGVEKVFLGLTTIEEVVRETMDVEE